MSDNNIVTISYLNNIYIMDVKQHKFLAGKHIDFNGINIENSTHNGYNFNQDSIYFFTPLEEINIMELVYSIDKLVKLLDSITKIKYFLVKPSLCEEETPIYFEKMKYLKLTRNVTHLAVVNHINGLNLKVGHFNVESLVRQLNKAKNLNSLSLYGISLNQKDFEKLFNELDPTKERLINVRVNDSGLDEIPSSLLKHSNLNELDLSHNNISDLNPLLKLKKLKFINLNENKIVDIKPIYKISNLDIVNMKGNCIDEINCDKLKHISVASFEARVASNIITSDFKVFYCSNWSFPSIKNVDKNFIDYHFNYKYKENINTTIDFNSNKDLLIGLPINREDFFNEINKLPPINNYYPSIYKEALKYKISLGINTKECKKQLELLNE